MTVATHSAVLKRKCVGIKRWSVVRMERTMSAGGALGHPLGGTARGKAEFC